MTEFIALLLARTLFSEVSTMRQFFKELFTGRRVRREKGARFSFYNSIKNVGNVGHIAKHCIIPIYLAKCKLPIKILISHFIRR